MAGSNCCGLNRFDRMTLDMVGIDFFSRTFVPGVALAIGLSACPAQRAMQVPPGQAAVVSPNPAGSSNLPTEKTSPFGISQPAADGAACFSGSECASTICEGASCDGQTPGTCAPEDRVCTADVVEYCGCDGKTFESSSGCPGESFANLGPCEAPARPAEPAP